MWLLNRILEYVLEPRHTEEKYHRSYGGGAGDCNMYSPCSDPTGMDCNLGEVVMEDTLGRGELSSLDGIKTRLPDAAPNPPARSSISRGSGEDMGGSEKRGNELSWQILQAPVSSYYPNQGGPRELRALMGKRVSIRVY